MSTQIASSSPGGIGSSVPGILKFKLVKLKTRSFASCSVIKLSFLFILSCYLQNSFVGNNIRGPYQT